MGFFGQSINVNAPSFFFIDFHATIKSHANSAILMVFIPLLKIILSVNKFDLILYFWYIWGVNFEKCTDDALT